MSKTNFLSSNANKSEGMVSVHSKWSAGSEEAKYKPQYSKDHKQWSGKNNPWGPFFKNRAHFNEMHMS